VKVITRNIALAILVITFSVLFLVWSQTMSLPLGDGKVSRAPKAGYVFACPAPPGPPLGAQKQGNWITETSWNPATKVVVDGEVMWQHSRLEIAVENMERVIRANNLPTHPTGIFPISPEDDAYDYDRNPNAILEQTILLTLPVIPQEASEPSCLPMGMIGFALTGVAIYNALDAQQRDAPAHEIQDACNGHPERTGQYHYHDWSECLSTLQQSDTAFHSALIGYAIDGFGIYGLRGEEGQELTNTDLDVCHGHRHKMSWDNKELELYHYHMTREYPYTLGCFKGNVIEANRPVPPARP
jgi:YHYH protein